MNQRNKKLYGRALRGILGYDGYGTFGQTKKATLFVGREVGLSTGPKPEGTILTENQVVGKVMGLRVEQAGPAAGATIVSAKGVYKGKHEPSVKIELVDTGIDRGPNGFQRNVKQLAENVAKELGQREVIIEWQDGKKTTTATASPAGAPSPTSPKFCDWVRRNSESARSNPQDACYEPERKAKKMKKQSGFTLIELMIVVAIIGILAAVAIPAFMDYMKRSKRTEASLQLKSISEKTKTYWISRNDFPPSSATDLPGADGAACPNKFPVAALALWEADPAWGSLDFHIDEEALFTYHFTKVSSTAANATAVGDLDCDSTKISYSLDLVSNGGNVGGKIYSPDDFTPPQKD